MSVIKIVRGRQHGAARVAVYGVEGIGKSTLAAEFPSPVILDTEDGTRHLEAARVRIDDWKTLTLAVAELAVSPQGFRTVVIDSIDWAERLLVEWMLKAAGKKSIEDFGFGKGYVLLQEHVGRFLADLDRLIDAGIHVVLVGHAAVKRTSPPDQTEGFDRYELKLTRQVAPLVKEWADALLFANYRVKLIEGADGRTKAVGGKERILFAERSAAWDAKNRLGLPAELPMTIEALAPLFGEPAKPAAKRGKPADEPLVVTIAKHVAEASSVRTLGKIGDRIDELASQGDLTEEEVAELMGAINARHQQIEPQEAAT